MEKDDVLNALDAIILRAQSMKSALQGGKAGKAQFLSGTKTIETQCVVLRAAVIRQSRAQKQGLKVDGTPDLRFLRNRQRLLRQGDLRYSNA